MIVLSSSMTIYVISFIHCQSTADADSTAEADSSEDLSVEAAGATNIEAPSGAKLGGLLDEPKNGFFSFDSLSDSD